MSGLLAAELAAGPIAAWLVPDPAHRRPVLHAYARFVLAHGLAHGQVDTTCDRTAVAVWYPRRAAPEPAAALLFGLCRVLGAQAARFALLHAQTDAVHPHIPHHHLAQLAGDHDAARRLLVARHRLLDPHGLPSYAEVVTDRPRECLLGRLGYAPRTPVLLGGGPALWRMWRAAPATARRCRAGCGCTGPR
ncbi:N-acetyltransferase [Micromonospora sp. Llam7]|uniref:N-acetyltransferase n=1 Tax=Micromonospora tarapacensis TaxID=2835305 RepID=UPI001C82FAF2|nr:N-acetyltransferase [Micromonospora tarapacensis]MBX7267363.1 N-acetyltransferase [Micromonospora tarapacensis]